MKAKYFRWPFLVMLMLLFVGGNLSGPVTFGVTSEWSDGNYSFAAGTAPWLLGFAALILLMYLLLMFSPPAEAGPPMPGIFRRFVAFFIDFFFAMFSIAPILGIIPVLTEWKRTGVFAWHFERNIYAPGDAVLTWGLVTPTFALLALYYAWPLMRGRPSPGSCILGYQIITDDGTALTRRKAFLRTLKGFLAVCSWPFQLFRARDRKNGKFSLDEEFGTRAVKLR
ncbi:MAG: RDD family protein [Terracidiphilus sp.]